MIRRSLLVLFVLLLSLILTIPALAGGWAVISLDSLPGEVVAGQPITVGFTVLQHGRTPLSGLDPAIRLTSSASGESLTVHAVDEGKVGHYTATFTLPESGRWSWSIQAFSMDQPMPELVASEPSELAAAGQLSGSGSSQPVNSLLSAPILIGLAGIAAAGLGMIYAMRRRSRWAMAVVVVGLLVGVAGFARAGIAAASARSVETNKPASSPVAVDLSSKGEALFIAKGCLSCHTNTRVDARFLVFSTEMGPDLTGYKTSPEYLHLWLDDPSAVKPQTQMPDLGLSQAEIDALTAFLLDEGQD